jgi:hypothetical protein
VRDLAAAVQAARQALGASAEQVLARIGETERVLARLRAEQSKLVPRQRALNERAGRADTGLDGARAAAQQAADALSEAVVVFRLLQGADFLRLALGEEAPEDHAAASGWDAERVAQVAAREQRIFADELAGDIAEHPYDRVHAAHAWVEEAKDTTRQCATSSGMRVHLQFVEREEDQPGVRRALTLLRKNPAALSDAEREELVAFLRRRISDARASGETGSTIDLLVGALDYRAWHEFRMEVALPDGTRKRRPLWRRGV